MQIIVGKTVFTATAILSAIITASPEMAARLAENPGKRKSDDVFNVDGTQVSLSIVKNQVEIKINIERNLDLDFTLEEGDDEYRNSLSFLGRNGDRAVELETAGKAGQTFGETVANLPALLQPFADCVLEPFTSEFGHWSGEDLVILDLVEPAPLAIAA